MEDRKFTILLAQEEDHINILYHTFQPKDVQPKVIIKRIFKPKKIDIDKLHYKEKGE